MKNEKSIGFFETIKQAFQFAIQNFLTYLWFSLILMVPFLIAGAVIGFFAFTTFNASAQEPSPMLINEPAIELTETIDSEKMELIDNGGMEKVLENINSATGSEAEFNDYMVEVFSTFGWPIVAFLILFLIFILYSMYVALVLVRLTAVLYQEGKASVGEVLAWAWHHLASYLMLTLRILIYTFAWAPLLVTFAFAVVQTLVSSQILVVNPETLGMFNLVMGVLSFAFVILMFYRIPRALFAQYIFADRSLASKDALDYSVKISQGNWWKIMGYIFVAVLLSGFAMSLVEFIFSRLGEGLNTFIQMILNMIFGYFFIALYFFLYKRFDAK